MEIFITWISRSLSQGYRIDDVEEILNGRSGHEKSFLPLTWDSCWFQLSSLGANMHQAEAPFYTSLWLFSSPLDKYINLSCLWCVSVGPLFFCLGGNLKSSFSTQLYPPPWMLWQWLSLHPFGPLADLAYFTLLLYMLHLTNQTVSSQKAKAMLWTTLT